MAQKPSIPNTLAQQYDALLRACRTGDHDLLDALETTDLDYASGGRTALSIALENNHLDIAVRVARKSPKVVLNALINAFGPYGSSAVERTLAANALIPLAEFEIPHTRHLLEDSKVPFDEIAYILLLFTPAEFELLSPIVDAQIDRIPQNAIQLGLDWLSAEARDLSNEFVFAFDWASKRLGAPQLWEDVFNTMLLRGCPDIGHVIRTNQPHVRAKGVTVLKLFKSHLWPQLQPYVPLLKNVNCSMPQAREIVDKFIERELCVVSDPFTRPDTTAEQLSVISPYIHMLEPDQQEMCVAKIARRTYRLGIDYLRTEFPDVWSRCAEQMGQSMLEGGWFNHQYVYDIVALPSEKRLPSLSKGIRDCFNDGLFDLAAEDYQDPEIVSACVHRCNAALLRKMLHHGGVVCEPGDWSALIKWADDDVVKQALQSIDAATLFQSFKSCSMENKKVVEFLLHPVVNNAFEKAGVNAWGLCPTKDLLHFVFKTNNMELLERASQQVQWYENDDSEEDDPILIAIEHGATVEQLATIAKHHDPSANSSSALVRAAEQDRVDLVRFLLPLSNPSAHHSAALVNAIKNKNQDLFNMLLPLSHPRDGQSSALRWAVQERQEQMVKALIPLSNVALVQKIYNKEGLGESAQFLSECSAQVQNEMLYSLVGGIENKRKSKMI